jgi:hypothetical protein
MKKLFTRLSLIKPFSQFGSISWFTLSRRFALFIILVFIVTSVFGQAPTISSFSPVSGPVGTLVTINGTNLSLPTTLTIGGENAIVTSNSGSVLVAMVMPGTVTGAISITTAAGTATSSAMFSIAATQYPSAQQGPPLLGTGGPVTDINANQGRSVAVSADGNTAIFASNYSFVWIFTSSAGVWAQQGNKLVGSAVAISADGNTAILGDLLDNNHVGAARVYTRSGNTWSQQGPKLVGLGSVGASQMGQSVSLSADGNTAIVGGFQDNSGKGAAWIFVRNQGIWTQQGTKLVDPGSSVNQGLHVSMSADGNTAIVGAPSASTSGATIYTRSNGIWTQQGTTITVTNPPPGFFTGDAVSLSADGNTAMIGGGSGAAIFTRSSNTWNQQGPILVGTGQGSSSQGSSVSLSADGNTAIAGDSGDAWIFTRASGVWSQRGPGLVSNDVTDLGYSASISADGTTALVGAPDIVDDGASGGVYVFASGPAAPTVQATNVTFTNIKATSATVNWTNGNGTARAVFIAKNDVYYPRPVNGVSYAADTVFGAGATGDNLNSWYCIYNGTGSTVNVTGLTKKNQYGNKYGVMVIEYNSAVNSPRYLTTQATGNPNYFIGPSGNDTLKNLLTSNGSLTPAFAPATTSYTKSVPNATTTITFTPIEADTTARVTVNGTAVASGTASPPVTLVAGSNVVPIVVTAQDGTKLTYTVTVNRASSSDATLSNLSISTGTLKPAFVATTTAYSVAVGNGVTSITVTPTTNDPTATITVRGTAVTSGTASTPVNLVVGANTIAVIVTAQNGVTTKNYKITVTRAASTNAKLLTLATNHGGLTPAFNNTVYSYTKAVGNAVTSITFTPTIVDNIATITVNGTSVTSGRPSASLPLTVGDNAIAIKVTAGDGVTTLTYTVTVTRALAAANTAADNWCSKPKTTITAAKYLTDTATKPVQNNYPVLIFIRWITP